MPVPNYLSMPKDGRAIVFVDTRAAAKLLCTELQTEFAHLHPAYIVGHGRADGLIWEGENQQRDRINLLRTGKCQVLISTSVLEEGLDVPACDHVISFKAGTTLIQHIQRGGRVRKAGGSFKIITTADEREQITKIDTQEKIMDAMLSTFNRPSQEAQALLDLLRALRASSSSESSVGGNLDTERTKMLLDPVPDLAWSSDTLCFYVMGPIARGGNDILDSLKGTFEQIASVDISRAHFFPSHAVVHSGHCNLFQSTDSVLLLNLKACTPKTVFDICRTWDFRLPSLHTTPLTFWLRSAQQPSDSGDGCSAGGKSIYPTNISVGEFASYQTFISYAETFSCHWSDLCVQDGALLMNGTPLKYCYSDSDFDFDLQALTSLQVCFPLTSLLGCTLVVADRVHALATLYFTVQTAPKMTAVMTDNFFFFEKCKRIVLRNGQLGNECFGSYTERMAENDLLIFSKYRVFSVTVGMENLNDLVVFGKSLSVPLFHTHIVKVCKVCPQVRSSASLDKKEEHECMWQLGVLLEKRDMPCCGVSKFDLCNVVGQALERGSEKEGLHYTAKCRAILATLQQLSIIASSLTFFTDILPVYESMLRSYRHFHVSEPCGNTSTVKRVLITQTRIIPLPADTFQTCRLLARFETQYEFIIVKFVDENLQRLVSNSSTLVRVHDILSEGLIIMGRMYRFLFSTASQSRNQSAYFVAGTPAHVQHIRNTYVPEIFLTSITTAKYASRLALFGTSGIPTVPIPESKCFEILDKVSSFWSTSSTPTLVTDGAGRISPALAHRLWVAVHGSIDISPVPSAFIIRLAGMKGILVVDPSLPATDRIEYRLSMVKCPVLSERTLWVVKASRYIPLYLNREIITLLTSLSANAHAQGQCYDWNPDGKLYAMQEENLSHALSVLMNPTSARLTLTQYMGHENVPLPSSGIDLLTEPLWNNLLKIAYQKIIVDLRTKTKIFVKDGVLLIGIPDEFSCLKPKEVFLQIQKPNAGLQIITGYVLIYRNPCLHPGDVQVCLATDKPQLHHLKNVLVLSCAPTGMPLAAACSGGDLDGDMFAVVWTPGLVPPPTVVFQPLNYNEVAENAKQGVSVSMANKLSLEDFFIKVISNDTLGRIAHIHLALADIQKLGACDHIAMKLAESQSLAVDFPKTGVAPQVPKEALDIVNLVGYPDFMEKGAVRSYVSNKILGTLYRRCRFFFVDAVVKDLVPLRGLVLDHFLTGEISQVAFFAENAQEVYARYQASCEQLMMQFGLHNEAELMLGTRLRWDTHWAADKRRAELALKAAWVALKRAFRSLFFENVDFSADSGKERAYAKAAAWYQVAYKKENKKGRFLTFPWLVQDILCDMKATRLAAGFGRVLLSVKAACVMSNIGLSANTVFVNVYSKDLLRLMIRRIGLLKELSYAVNDYLKSQHGQALPVEMQTYGSLALFVCDQYSDMDVYVDRSVVSCFEKQKSYLLEEKDVQRAFLDMCIAPAVETIALKSQKIFSTRVPILRCTLGDDEESINVDISADRGGVRKAEYILRLYAETPIIFRVFLLVVNFCRESNIIRSALSHSRDQPCSPSLLKTTHLHALILHTFTPCTTTTTTTVAVPTTNADGLQKMLSFLMDCQLAAKEDDNKNLGQVVLEFFSRVVKLKGSGDWTFTWPIAGCPSEIILADAMDQVADLCEIALHSLVYSQSWDSMCKYVSDLNQENRFVELPLSRALSSAISHTKDFHKAFLEFESGALVHFQEAGNKLILHGAGVLTKISKLRNVIKTWMQDLRGAQFGRLPSRSSAYFIAGATAVFIIGDTSNFRMLKFVHYFGPCLPLHKQSSRSIPIPVSIPVLVNGERWLESFSAMMAEKTTTQLQSLHSAPALASLVFSVQFGIFYLMQVENATEAVNGKMSISDLELAISRHKARKQFARSEFTLSEPRGPSLTKHQSIVMTPLKTTAGGSDRTRKNMRHNIGSSFCPGLFKPWPPIAVLNQVPLTGTAPSRTLTAPCALERQFQIMHDILAKTGFRAQSTSTEPSYNVVFIAATCFVFNLRLDANFELISLQEKPLSWVHATLVDNDGGNYAYDEAGSLPSPLQHRAHAHIRMKIQTVEDVPASSDMYAIIFGAPEQGVDIFHLSGEKRRPPIILGRDGFPQIAPHLSYEATKRLSFVRQLKRVDVFKKDGLTATVSMGFNMVFNKGTLTDIQPFFELALHEKTPPPLMHWLEGKASAGIMQQWYRSTMDTVLQLHNELSQPQYEKLNLGTPLMAT